MYICFLFLYYVKLQLMKLQIGTTSEDNNRPFNFILYYKFTNLFIYIILIIYYN